VKRLARVIILAGFALASLPGPASAQTGTTQHFTIIDTGGDTTPVIASGTINAIGAETSTRNPAHPAAPYTATFAFPQGDVLSTVTPGRPQIRFNPTTCVTKIAEPDSFIVTAGTGKYVGASGHGTATVNVATIGGRSPDGSCLGPRSKPIFELVIIRATGSLSLT
jgi:hypothetical protein